MGRKIVVILFIFLFCFIAIKQFEYFTYEFSHTGDMKYGDALISPDGQYAAQMYFDHHGGAGSTNGVNVIVNIIDLENNLKERTVYFSDGKGSPLLQWHAPHHLEIQNLNSSVDRSVTLKIPEEIYDEQGNACETYKVKQQYVCYDKDSILNNKFN